jgi:dienelactone hydrolase
MIWSLENKCSWRLLPSLQNVLLTIFAIAYSSSLLSATDPETNLVSTNQSKLPKDVRLEPLKDLNGYFPMKVPQSVEEWEKRAEVVRNQMQVATGLYPWPTKTPLNPVIHGKIDRGDYTIEKVYFESMPGFFVTGNLYRPKGVTKPAPAILCPHGHWANGRFYDAGEEATKREIAAGAELFPDSGRSPLQARCVHLARMGCVVFHYDMLGNADSQQITAAIVHGFAKQRPEMNTSENWGLFSPQAESHLQSIMGLQTWNSIRSVDFVLTLPDVDPNRIGVTGASGGGTQTMILAALDDRIKASFPAVMVSTSMQGGCTCENCCLLRINTGNIEFAALFAPKPQAMTAANDWTKEMSTKGFPEIKQLYALYGKANEVALSDHTEFGHNYNAVSRKAMYELMNKAFNLNADVIERDYTRSSIEEMSVWNADHPQPESGEAFERKLMKQWLDDSQSLIAKQLPTDKASHQKFQGFMHTALSSIFGRGFSEALNTETDLEFDQAVKEERDGYFYFAGQIKKSTRSEVIPVIMLQPKSWNKQVVIWTSETGKQLVADANSQPTEAASKMLQSGFAVIGADLFMQGDFLDGSEPVTKARKVAENRESAAYSFGYNYTLFAQRAQDIVSLVAFAKSHERSPSAVHLVALDKTGPIATTARALCGNNVSRAAINTHGFRFGQVNDYLSVDFVPGAAKYGDIDGLLAVAAPGEILLAGEGETVPAMMSKTYDALGARSKITKIAQPAIDQVIDWLIKK